MTLPARLLWGIKLLFFLGNSENFNTFFAARKQAMLQLVLQ